MQSGKSNGLSRRQVVRGAAMAAAATTAFPYVLRGAASDKPLKVGLIGCGGRGTGAAHNAIAADPAVRIVALADVYDALTSKRVYKDAFSHQEAKKIITESRGTHFAPDVVDAFLTHEEDFRRIREELFRDRENATQAFSAA